MDFLLMLKGREEENKKIATLLINKRAEEDIEIASIQKKMNDDFNERSHNIQINMMRSKINPYVDTEVKCDLSYRSQRMTRYWRERFEIDKKMVAENSFKCELCDNNVEIQTDVRKYPPKNNGELRPRLYSFMILTKRNLCNNCEPSITIT